MGVSELLFVFLFSFISGCCSREVFNLGEVVCLRVVFGGVGCKVWFMCVYSCEFGVGRVVLEIIF